MLGKFQNSPPKWTDVYPQGSKEGDEEQRFFISLARNKKFGWRSVAALKKESKLTTERVEEIIQKYHSKAPGMIVNSPKNPTNWGYWERVKDELNGDPASLTKKDQKDRLDKADPVAQTP
jgi:hypothetical protein